MDDTIYISLLLILVGVGSFWLGRSSVVLPELEMALQNHSGAKEANIVGAEPVNSKLQQSDLVGANRLPATIDSSSSGSVLNQEGTLVASKSGTKYHKLTCPGAKQIKEENKIYFNSVKEAEASGYSKAANCPD